MSIFDIFRKKTEGSSAGSIVIKAGDASMETKIKLCPDIAAAEKEMEQFRPCCDGLYPHEVLVLDYAPYFYVGQDNFQTFWEYSYGVKDVNAVIQSLLDRGYISIGTTVDAIKSEKVAIIKEELKKQGLKTSGKKAELVERLISEVPEKILAKTFTKRPYHLTERGQSVLEKYEWVPFIHSKAKGDVDLWEFAETMERSDGTDYRDVLMKYLDEKSAASFKRNHFGFYRNYRFRMYQFSMAFGHKEDAFRYLCEVIACDLTPFFSNSDRLPDRFLLAQMADNCFPYKRSSMTLPPGIIEELKKCVGTLGWTDNEVRSKAVGYIDSVKLPVRPFTAEECVDILLAEMRGDKEYLSDVYRTAEKRFRKRYK